MKKLLLLIVMTGSLFAQRLDVGLTVNDEHFYIGDRIKIDLNVRGAEKQMFVLPDVREWIKDVMILNVKTDRSIKKNIQTITMHIEAAGFDTGFVHIPAMPVVRTDSTGFGKPDTIFSPEKYVYIYSILDSSAAPVAVSPPVPLSLMIWWEFLIALGLLAAAVFLLIIGIKYHSKKKIIEEEIWESPKEKAEHYLDELEKKHYPENEQWKKFYLELTYIARDYFENIYYIHLQELTTTDLIPVLKEQVPEEYQDKLREFFQYADLVKFAKGVANIEQCGQHYELIKDIVEKDEGSASANAMADKEEINEEDSMAQST